MPHPAAAAAAPHSAAVGGSLNSSKLGTKSTPHLGLFEARLIDQVMGCLQCVQCPAMQPAVATAAVQPLHRPCIHCTPRHTNGFAATRRQAHGAWGQQQQRRQLTSGLPMPTRQTTAAPCRRESGITSAPSPACMLMSAAAEEDIVLAWLCQQCWGILHADQQSIGVVAAEPASVPEDHWSGPSRTRPSCPAA